MMFRKISTYNINLNADVNVIDRRSGDTAFNLNARLLADLYSPGNPWTMSENQMESQKMNREKILSILLNAGANKSIRDKGGKRAIDYVRERCNRQDLIRRVDVIPVPLQLLRDFMPYYITPVLFLCLIFKVWD